MVFSKCASYFYLPDEVWHFFINAYKRVCLFIATIQGGNLAEMAQQIKNVIASEQEKPIWVPSSTLR
ncbi:hypothetical protein DPMN_035038 [Dreissena polymorpha]|uniref:Uncharacterized protein n=1 Tax=Dreissena polymorpha TaxID=45954 RepID=A0A9D4M7X7_DREPO|nr:hypothetical protein DPMN_035038 [Dreissena polymorpha]